MLGTTIDRCANPFKLAGGIGRYLVGIHNVFANSTIVATAFSASGSLAYGIREAGPGQEVSHLLMWCPLNRMWLWEYSQNPH